MTYPARPLPEFPKMTPTRTENFVPLIAAPPRPLGERPEFRVAIAKKPGKVQKIQAALGNFSAANPPARAGGCEPKVNLQRDGNRVTGIQVKCSCGQVMELSCVYEGGQSTPTP